MLNVTPIQTIAMTNELYRAGNCVSFRLNPTCEHCYLENRSGQKEAKWFPHMADRTCPAAVTLPTPPHVYPTDYFTYQYVLQFRSLCPAPAVPTGLRGLQTAHLAGARPCRWVLRWQLQPLLIAVSTRVIFKGELEMQTRSYIQFKKKHAKLSAKPSVIIRLKLKVRLLQHGTLLQPIMQK